ncbi:MAG: aromatic ring-hydroxylating dioxygenase subunit alpha [Pseudomonadota bacterium]|nr:aromatic ring-hydroxylating dioxygenase subunit alpha [Pseudomonadota bacterium]
MTQTAATELDLESLLRDDPAAGLFQVHRDAFLDPRVFEREMTHIFEGTWVFVGLESEVAQPHDFVTRQIGRQPVVLARDGDGILRCFLNSCSHRGTLLCPDRAGNRRFHVCPYHGWTFDSAGRNLDLTDRAHGRYSEGFLAQSQNLTAVPRLASYRGFVFASLSPEVPHLDDHLGEARLLLDLVADQGPDGLEYVPGSASYTFDGNWKLQFENGLDAYHFATTHAAFVDIVRRRPPPPPPDGQTPATPPGIVAGTISVPRGHAMSWSIGAPGQGAENRPLPRDAELLERVRRAVGDERLGWMLRQRNLTIFPNLQIIDIQSLQVRTWQPLAVNSTRMNSHCLAPVGESAAARRFRIRQYEEFFNAGGLASSDDNVMYDLNQIGLAARGAGPTQGYGRGMTSPPPDPAPFAALGIDAARCTSSDAGLAFGDETGMHAGYREWHRLLTGRRVADGG